MKLVIVGCGGHAKVILDICHALNIIHCVVGCLGESKDAGTDVLGIDVIGTDEDMSKLAAEGVTHAIVALGNNSIRKEKCSVLTLLGYQFPVLIHPSAIISSYASIGAGSVVAAGAILNPAVEVAEHVILNTGATIDHDCKVESFAHISPGVHLAGGVVIGEGAHIGTGTNVIPGKVVGPWSVIGAGSAVVRSIAGGMVAYGVPCIPIRDTGA